MTRSASTWPREIHYCEHLRKSAQTRRSQTRAYADVHRRDPRHHRPRSRRQQRDFQRDQRHSAETSSVSRSPKGWSALGRRRRASASPTSRPRPPTTSLSWRKTAPFNTSAFGPATASALPVWPPRSRCRALTLLQARSRPSAFSPLSAGGSRRRTKLTAVRKR